MGTTPIGGMSEKGLGTHLKVCPQYNICSSDGILSQAFAMVAAFRPVWTPCPPASQSIRQTPGTPR